MEKNNNSLMQRRDRIYHNRMWYFFISVSVVFVAVIVHVIRKGIIPITEQRTGELPEFGQKALDYVVGRPVPPSYSSHFGRNKRGTNVKDLATKGSDQLVETLRNEIGNMYSTCKIFDTLPDAVYKQVPMGKLDRASLLVVEQVKKYIHLMSNALFFCA